MSVTFPQFRKIHVLLRVLWPKPPTENLRSSLDLRGNPYSGKVPDHPGDILGQRPYGGPFPDLLPSPDT